jgi:hypothetical protein
VGKFIGNRVLPLGTQLIIMQRVWPGFVSRWKHSAVIWTGPLQPTDMSPVYKVQISYALEKRPDVVVRSPALCDRPDQPIQHVYPGKRLCLYLPRANEWTPAMPIAETIVPWACDGLYFYEIWHATGEWLADGVHPKQKHENRHQ